MIEVDMGDFVPLFVQWSWILVMIVLLVAFRRELSLLRQSVVSRLERGGSIEFGSFKLGELRRDLESVRDELDQTTRLASELFLSTMSRAMYVNLKKLNSGFFGPNEKNEGLARQLYHLRSIGYIVVESVRAIPDAGPDLAQHVGITPSGERFVQLRELVLANANVLQNEATDGTV